MPWKQCNSCLRRWCSVVLCIDSKLMEALVTAFARVVRLVIEHISHCKATIRLAALCTYD